ARARRRSVRVRLPGLRARPRARWPRLGTRGVRERARLLLRGAEGGAAVRRAGILGGRSRGTRVGSRGLLPGGDRREPRAARRALVAEPAFAPGECAITADDALHREYLERIPVVALDGEELFEYFVDEGELRERLESRR